MLNYLRNKYATMLLLGFYSGFPLSFTSSTLQAWLTDLGLTTTDMKFISLIGFPYTVKFLWAPLLESYFPKILDHRRGWLLLFQIAITVALIFNAFTNPSANSQVVMVIAALIALFSASQDVIFDAYKIDVLSAKERGLGAALGVEGYRIAMMVSSAGTLIYAEKYGWQNAYLCMAAIMSMSILVTLFAPSSPTQLKQNNNPYKVLRDSFNDFINKEHALIFMVLIALYKIADALAMSFSTKFLMSEIGLIKSELAILNKALPLVGTLMGIFFGGVILLRVNLYYALIFFGILQAVTNFSFSALAAWGPDPWGWNWSSYYQFSPAYEYLNYLLKYPLVTVSLFFDHVFGGMGTTALLALLMSWCNKQFAATQFAILTSISALGRSFASPISDYLITSYGWANFFSITALSGIPSILLLLYICTKPQARGLDNSTNKYREPKTC